MPCGCPKNPPELKAGLTAKAAAPLDPPLDGVETDPGAVNVDDFISAIALFDATAIAATWAIPKIGPKIGPNCWAAPNASNDDWIAEVTTAAILYFLDALNAFSEDSSCDSANVLAKFAAVANDAPTALPALLSKKSFKSWFSFFKYSPNDKALFSKSGSGLGGNWGKIGGGGVTSVPPKASSIN